MICPFTSDWNDSLSGWVKHSGLRHCPWNWAAAWGKPLGFLGLMSQASQKSPAQPRNSPTQTLSEAGMWSVCGLCHHRLPRIQRKGKLLQLPHVLPLALTSSTFATIIPWAFAGSVHIHLLEADALPVGIMWDTLPGVSPALIYIENLQGRRS